jgi:hypothetical protein
VISRILQVAAYDGYREAPGIQPHFTFSNVVAFLKLQKPHRSPLFSLDFALNAFAQ